MEKTSEIFGGLLGTHEANDKERSAEIQKSTNYRLSRGETLECLITKKTSQIDITQTGSDWYSNTDVNIADILMIWMQSAHQSQSSKSPGYKLYIQVISAYN